jgi:hypothetical protein
MFTIKAAIRSEGEVVAYYLEDDDGNKMQCSKRYTLYLVDNNRISNAYIQEHRKKRYLRGIKVNLYRLPEYKAVDSTVRHFGELEVTKRITKSGKTIGYCVRGIKGDEFKYSLNKIKELARAEHLSNMGIKGEEIVEGDTELGEIYIDRDNNMIDVSDVNTVVVRGYQVTSGGSINDEVCMIEDWIVIGIKGEVRVIKRGDFEKEYSTYEGSRAAICDTFIRAGTKIVIERFDGKKEVFKGINIVRWDKFSYNAGKDQIK